MGKKNFGGKMANQRWKHDPNPWKPLLLIPNDVGVGPIFTNYGGRNEDEHEERDEHEEHGGVAREIRGKHKR